MIWINIKKMEASLASGEVSDKIAFIYLLFHLVAMSVMGHLVSDEDPLWSVWVHLAISLGAMLWGVSKTFEINQQGDNRDYFKRILSLSFVAGLRCLLIVAFIFSSLNLVIAKVGISIFEDPFYEAINELVGYACFIIFFYYVLLRSFRRINSKEVRGAGF